MEAGQNGIGLRIPDWARVPRRLERTEKEGRQMGMMRKQRKSVKQRGQTVNLATIRPRDRNPRTITDEALERLRASIERDPQFMELRPIVIDESGVILGGTQRYRACLRMGMKAIPSSWVKVATGITAEQRRRFTLIDNAPDGMSGRWDTAILAEDWELPELQALGFADLADLVVPPIVDNSGMDDTRTGRVGLTGKRGTMVVSVGMMNEVVPREMVERLSSAIKNKWADLPITRFVEWANDNITDDE